jgi:hypothetical protein
MLLNKNIKEFDSFLDINNDIYRIVSELNNGKDLKKLLKNTDSNPLKGQEVTADLRETQINRIPLIPDNEANGSICVVSVVKGDIDEGSDSINLILAIDVFTPGNQWIINEGIRPLIIANEIDNIMKKSVNQTGGIKYRLTDFISAKLSDILIGYRLLYGVVIDD